MEILDRASMLNCKSVSTHADLSTKFDGSGPPVQDPTLYRSLAGALQYLTFTRPDITYSVQQVCLYMHDPREPHFTALKRILRYVRGTLNHGLQIFSSHSRDIVAYSDVDWAGCPVTRRSTYGYCNPVQHQRTKHIEIDLHFVRDMVATGQVRVLHVPSKSQYADIFTKSLPSSLFLDFRSSLNVRDPTLVQTAGVVNRKWATRIHPQCTLSLVKRPHRAIRKTL
ncbi:uncharacterized mitochondrial protein AtMg00810-like [Lactuca sativa]|uniref:uncharacterized mitochondrial protein AtMg00810-like n=1 Tax=Lactuca sativa TaxID=4236 RepID=UPI0022AFCCAA|nr:uncharacterized mitochondrial protein AtMg00810-like [Lactuca sativa]